MIGVRSALATLLDDEPELNSWKVGEQAIRAGRRRRHRRAAGGAAALLGVATLAAIPVVPHLLDVGAVRTVTAAVSPASDDPQSSAVSVRGAQVDTPSLLRVLLREQGLTIDSTHGFSQLDARLSAQGVLIRGGYNVSEPRGRFGSVDVQIGRPIEPCRGSSCRLVISDDVGRPGAGSGSPSLRTFTTVLADRYISITARNYALSASGEAVADAPASELPLSDETATALIDDERWSTIALD